LLHKSQFLIYQKLEKV